MSDQQSESKISRFQLSRRRFAFWVGMGLFSLSETLRADSLDGLAAASMRATEPSPAKGTSSTPEHWTSAENNTWHWFERENLIDGRWKLTGITTPIHKQTGEPFSGHAGYLDNSLVPLHVQRDDQSGLPPASTDTAVEVDAGQPSSMRRARHGRPPSRWLRSLHAAELRIWLRKIDVPEAGVEGMTYWDHLTRDHYFEAGHIAGLNIEEQAKLHAAAHHGY